MPNWQTIETAPSDGRPVLVFGGRHYKVNIVGADGDWWRSDHLEAPPTHWMPVPDTPSDMEKDYV